MPALLSDAKQLLIEAGAVLALAGQGDMIRGHVSMQVPGMPEGTVNLLGGNCERSRKGRRTWGTQLNGRLSTLGNKRSYWLTRWLSPRPAR